MGHHSFSVKAQMLLSIVILLICTSSSISFIGERCSFFYQRNSQRCTHLKPIEAVHDEDHFAASCHGEIRTVSNSIVVEHPFTWCCTLYYVGANQIVCLTDNSRSNGRATTDRNRQQLHAKSYLPKEHQNLSSSQLWAWLRAKRVAESRLQHAIRKEEVRTLNSYHLYPLHVSPQCVVVS